MAAMSKVAKGAKTKAFNETFAPVKAKTGGFVDLLKGKK